MTQSTPCDAGPGRARSLAAEGATRCPAKPRLDAPGTLRHVILRRMERGTIVADDADQAAVIARLGAVATATGTKVYAWALLPNHAHLVLRSGPAGLPRFMRRFLTGCALAYNRRHHRVGHVFQNRYTSSGRAHPRERHLCGADVARRGAETAGPADPGATPPGGAGAP